MKEFPNTMQDRFMASLPGYTTGEIAYICALENVRRLANVFLRRTAITMEGLLTPYAIQETAKIAADTLGWNKKRMAKEIEHTTTELARRSIINVRSDAAHQ